MPTAYHAFLGSKIFVYGPGMELKRVDWVMPTAEADLACDEALLDWCEVEGGAGFLRWWEPKGVFVVVGYGNVIGSEVRVAACRRDGVPILRRCTGGGTVLQAEGVLNYSLVLPVAGHDALQTVPGTNCFVLQRMAAALSEVVGEGVVVRGHTDLVVGQQKISGNAQRRKRLYLLFHGTFLLGMKVELLERYLNRPSKQPEYRAGRSHTAFVRNLACCGEDVKARVERAWEVKEAAGAGVRLAVERDVRQLVRECYGNAEWVWKRTR